MDILIVAAIAENGVIGRGNALPWRLKSDMQHFRALTMGKPVIMGRKTYLSIGKPLAGRTTIVVSRDPKFAAPGLVVAPSLDAALGGGARRRAAAQRRGDRHCRRRRPLCPGDAGWRRVWSSPTCTSASTAMCGFRRSIAEFGAKSPATSMRRRAGDEAAFAFVTYARATAAAPRPPSAA